MISLILTVLNEEKTIGIFLDSVYKQIKLPDEIVIVDGGSGDETIKKLQSFKVAKFHEGKISLKIIQRKGLNRSEGRNLAIKNAKGEIIAVSDAGCILDKNWLKNITKPFEERSPGVKMVAGYYLPLSDSVFQKCVAPFFCVMEDRVAKDEKKKNFEFLPSSRSIAFRKSVWEKVGGYPENFNYCEDLIFDQKIKKAGYRFVFTKKAVVYWPQRKNLMSVFKQFFNYAKGDGQIFFSPFQTHTKKIIFLFVRFFVFLLLFFLSFMFSIFGKVLLVLVFVYLLREILQKYKYVSSPVALLYLHLIKIIGDIAVMSGTIYGLIQNENE